MPSRSVAAETAKPSGIKYPSHPMPSDHRTPTAHQAQTLATYEFPSSQSATATTAAQQHPRSCPSQRAQQCPSQPWHITRPTCHPPPGTTRNRSHLASSIRALSLIKSTIHRQRLGLFPSRSLPSQVVLPTLRYPTCVRYQCWHLAGTCHVGHLARVGRS